MKWHKATKVLPPPGQTVLVKNPDAKYDYILCTLAAADSEAMFDFVFFLYSDYTGGSIEIKKGTLWTRITLPE